MTSPFASLCRALAAASSLVLLGLLAGCDYPEQGFFLLTGMDADGQAVSKTVFEIVELVDDTDLTYGFTVHLYDPATKRVVDLPFENAPDLTRRGWLFSVSDVDFGHGDLALDFTHDEQLSFVGVWRGSRPRPWPLAGKVATGEEEGPSDIEFDLPIPDGQPAVMWKAVKLSESAAAKLLGAKPKSFKHIKGTAPDGLDPEQGRYALADSRGGAVEPETAPPTRAKPARPPLGGKGQP
jgi:hypothetical protein